MQNACKCRRFVLAGGSLLRPEPVHKLIDVRCESLGALRQHEIVAVDHLRLRHVTEQFLKLR